MMSPCKSKTENRKLEIKGISRSSGDKKQLLCARATVKGNDDRAVTNFQAMNFDRLAAYLDGSFFANGKCYAVDEGETPVVASRQTLKLNAAISGRVRLAHGKGGTCRNRRTWRMRIARNTLNARAVGYRGEFVNSTLAFEDLLRGHFEDQRIAILVSPQAVFPGRQTI